MICKRTPPFGDGVGPLSTDAERRLDLWIRVAGLSAGRMFPSLIAGCVQPGSLHSIVVSSAEEIQAEAIIESAPALLKLDEYERKARSRRKTALRALWE